MSVKLLSGHHLKFLSLKEGCTGSPESTLVKIPHCWKIRVTAQFGFCCNTAKNNRWLVLLLHLLVKRNQRNGQYVIDNLQKPKNYYTFVMLVTYFCLPASFVYMPDFTYQN